MSSRTSNLSSKSSLLGSKASNISRHVSVARSRASSPLFVGDSDDDVVMLDGRPGSFNSEALRATKAADAEELRALMDELPPADSSVRGSMPPPSTAGSRRTTTRSLLVSGYNSLARVSRTPATPVPRTPSISVFPSVVTDVAQHPGQQMASEPTGLFVTRHPSRTYEPTAPKCSSPAQTGLSGDQAGVRHTRPHGLHDPGRQS
ncbi:hypothetical protein QBC36DRAFT_333637, partial [Triangularia setosa]